MKALLFPGDGPAAGGGRVDDLAGVGDAAPAERNTIERTMAAAMVETTQPRG